MGSDPLVENHCCKALCKHCFTICFISKALLTVLVIKIETTIICVIAQIHLRSYKIHICHATLQRISSFGKWMDEWITK